MKRNFTVPDKPRVLIILASRPLGGPGKGLLQFLRHAPKERLEHALAAFAWQGEEDFEFANVARAEGAQLCLMREDRRLDPRLFRRALELYRQHGCNIVQSHGYKGHILSYYLSRYCGAPWVAMAHGWTSENPKMELYNRLERLLLRYPDVAMGVSPKLYQTLAAIRGPGRWTELLLNAVDVNEIRGKEGGATLRANLGLQADQTVIGVFGRFSPEKGVKHAVEAFAQLAPGHGRAVLLLVGEGQEEALLRRRVAELGMQDRILFCGYQSVPRDYFEACDLVLLPSLSEGLPNVVLEAMALGRPVLATDVGGVREIITQGVDGWIVPAGGPGPLARAMQGLLDAGTDFAAVGALARAGLYPKFSAQARVQKLLSVYDRLLLRNCGYQGMADGCVQPSWDEDARH